MEEEKQIKESNKGLKILIVILVLLVVGLTGYIVYDKVINKEDKEITTEKKEEENEPVENKKFSYRLEDLGQIYPEFAVHKEKLIINDKTVLEGIFSNVKELNGAIVCHYSTNIEITGSPIVIINENGIVATIMGQKEINENVINPVKVSGDVIRSYDVNNNKLIITSDNGSQDPESVICKMTDKLIEFEFNDEIEYLENGKISTKKVSTKTAEEFMSKHGFSCTR